MLAIYAFAGAHAFDRMIVHYTIGRYTGVIENQSGPIWYYLPVLVLGFFPWIAFLPVGLAYGVAALRTSGTPPNLARLWRLAFTWIVVPLVFFSFAQTKLPNYVALELPALALVVALFFDAVVVKGSSRSIVVSAATVPIFIGLCAIAIVLFVRDNKLGASALAVTPDLVRMGTSIGIGSLIAAVLFARRSTIAAAPYVLGAAMVVAVDILAIEGLPHAEPFKPVPQLAAIIDAQRRPGDIVAIQSFRGANALVFYTAAARLRACAAGCKEERRRRSRDRRALHARTHLARRAAQATCVRSTYGRTRRLIASRGTGALYLIDGPSCHGD